MILAILSIIVVWLYEVPLGWAVAITVIGSLRILFSLASIWEDKSGASATI